MGGRPNRGPGVDDGRCRFGEMNEARRDEAVEHDGRRSSELSSNTGGELQGPSALVLEQHRFLGRKPAHTAFDRQSGRNRKCDPPAKTRRTLPVSALILQTEADELSARFDSVPCLLGRYGSRED